MLTMLVNILSLIAPFNSRRSFSMMLDCWRQDQDERPSFQELVERLEQLMLQEVENFDFDKVDESKDYYHVPETEENDDDENEGLE